MMNSENEEPAMQSPLLLLPRTITNLDINCDPGENVYINVRINSVDVKGLEMEIYKGMCNVKVVDSYNVQSSRLEQQCNVLVSTEEPAPSALQQLMSPGVQERVPQETIPYMGEDEHRGHTLQKIAETDPALQYFDLNEDDYIIEIADGNNRKYQCIKCKQIFQQWATYEQHLSGHASEPKSSVTFFCEVCGRRFHNAHSFLSHSRGHDDPNLECDRCHKVFASKVKLRSHIKLHKRKYFCGNCPRSFTSAENLNRHVAKVHLRLMQKACENRTGKHYSRKNRTKKKNESDRHKLDTSDTESAASVEKQSEFIQYEPVMEQSSDGKVSKSDLINKANLDIANIISNEMFLLHAKRTRQQFKKYKRCTVCEKSFDRVGDLKRHFIEHIIKSTLVKSPVNHYGTLTIQCVVCETDTFDKIGKYKAHLREHAKLNIYKCTLCDKSFSDCSNLSKHKKVHGIKFFQCDLCQRKFNSKKMIARHMGLHNTDSPLPCPYCDKQFHFESMLNKHINLIHIKKWSKFKCRFCTEHFKNLKGKWDHEWKTHNARSNIFDCLVCGGKFRRYLELKRHCVSVHNITIPLAKMLKGL